MLWSVIAAFALNPLTQLLALVWGTDQGCRRCIEYVALLHLSLVGQATISTWRIPSYPWSSHLHLPLHSFWPWFEVRTRAAGGVLSVCSSPPPFSDRLGTILTWRLLSYPCCEPIWLSNTRQTRHFVCVLSDEFVNEVMMVVHSLDFILFSLCPSMGNARVPGLIYQSKVGTRELHDFQIVFQRMIGKGLRCLVANLCRYFVHYTISMMNFYFIKFLIFLLATYSWSEIHCKSIIIILVRWNLNSCSTPKYKLCSTYLLVWTRFVFNIVKGLINMYKQCPTFSTIVFQRWIPLIIGLLKNKIVIHWST